MFTTTTPCGLICMSLSSRDFLCSFAIVFDIHIIGRYVICSKKANIIEHALPFIFRPSHTKLIPAHMYNTPINPLVYTDILGYPLLHQHAQRYCPHCSVSSSQNQHDSPPRSTNASFGPFTPTSYHRSALILCSSPALPPTPTRPPPAAIGAHPAIVLMIPLRHKGPWTTYLQLRSGPHRTNEQATDPTPCYSPLKSKPAAT